MSKELTSAYKRGMRFLRVRRQVATDRQTRPNWSASARLGRDPAARRLRDQLAAEFAIDKKAYLEDIRFAAAVETIVESCGAYARKLLLEGSSPQRREHIMRLSRTSDTRQQYRVEGVRDGRFRSVEPKGDDPVYDTVEFSEVTSRLRRARGWLVALAGQTKDGVPLRTRAELRRLAVLCGDAARSLRDFVNLEPQQQSTLPAQLRKAVVLSAIKNPVVRGEFVGMA